MSWQTSPGRPCRASWGQEGECEVVGSPEITAATPRIERKIGIRSDYFELKMSENQPVWAEALSGLPVSA